MSDTALSIIVILVFSSGFVSGWIAKALTRRRLGFYEEFKKQRRWRDTAQRKDKPKYGGLPVVDINVPMPPVKPCKPIEE